MLAARYLDAATRFSQRIASLSMVPLNAAAPTGAKLLPDSSVAVVADETHVSAVTPIPVDMSVSPMTLLTVTPLESKSSVGEPSTRGSLLRSPHSQSAHRHTEQSASQEGKGKESDGSPQRPASQSQNGVRTPQATAARVALLDMSPSTPASGGAAPQHPSDRRVGALSMHACRRFLALTTCTRAAVQARGGPTRLNFDSRSQGAVAATPGTGLVSCKFAATQPHGVHVSGFTQRMNPARAGLPT